MQIVDFFSKLALINIKTTPFAYRILQTMYDQMDVRYIPTPFINWNPRGEDDAWIWKHQLSENQVPPYLLQDCGNEVFIVVIIYILNTILWPMYFKRYHYKLVSMKLMFFFMYWTDFLELSLRTLGHFGDVTDYGMLTWDKWVSLG